MKARSLKPDLERANPPPEKAPEANPFVAALNLIEFGKEREAERLLLEWRPEDSEADAQRLALLGFVRWRQGDVDAYRVLALEAARKARTSFTLYHLGLALPPEKGLAALQEAFRSYSGDVEGEGRIAYALARVLRRLGRFREAHSWASLAALRRASAYYQLEELAMDLLVGETPIEDLAQQVLPFLSHKAVGPRLYAAWLQMWLARAGGKSVADHVVSLTSLMPAERLVFDLPAIILAVKDDSPALGWRLLRAAKAASGRNALEAALLDLSEGLLRFPQLEAAVHLERALPVLRKNVMEDAFRAQAHLASLLERPLAEPYKLIAEVLRPEVRSLFAPAGVFRQSPYLRTLGNGRLTGFPPVRRRGLEVLVLLLSHPEGLSGPQLAKALYGKPNVEAVKVEVSRLRGIGFEIASRPYRLLNPPAADFLDLKQLIAEGCLREALALYQGPLLPKSFAPGIETLRRELEYELREAVLASQDPNLLYTLAQRLEDDLELWEVVLKTLPSDDPRRPASLAWVCRLRAEYE